MKLNETKELKPHRNKNIFQKLKSNSNDTFLLIKTEMAYNWDCRTTYFLPDLKLK